MTDANDVPVPSMAQIDLLAEEIIEWGNQIRETVALLRAKDTRGSDVDEQ